METNGIQIKRCVRAIARRRRPLAVSIPHHAARRLTAIVTIALATLRCGLGAFLVVIGFTGPALAADCPGAPAPYGLIGDTWQKPAVRNSIGCATEAEHDVPGRKGRLQTFQNGQIAFVPDQGPRMTIWAIRNKNHIHVQWSSNDPNWSYDRYLIRWDLDGKNIGQRDISGKTEGWWDFDFDTPGTYTFVVEGHSGGGYHHGWTIPVGATVTPANLPPLYPSVDPAAAAAACPGAPIPYGLIGDTWRRVIVNPRIGCPIEPEHDVPGRPGRLQTFRHGQIAYVPDQGPRMTIWAIRDKAHFHVHWDTNDPRWDYSEYLIRWDRDGQNVGQRNIGGTRDGWWDFDFTVPGNYTFIVEGRSGAHFHHGWTIPIGGTVSPGDIPPPATPTPPPPQPVPPHLTVGPTNPVQSRVFLVKGDHFIAGHVVHIRVADDALNPNLFFQTNADSSGSFTIPLTIPCQAGVLHFSANDERTNSHDLTGNLWSNTASMNCQ